MWRSGLAAGAAADSQRGGFSLIEMLLVVTLLALLLTLALPAYQGSVLRNNRAAGKAALLEVAQRQEQFFSNNRIYSDSLQGLGYSVDGSDFFYVDNQSDRSDVSTGGGIYRISMVRLSTLAFSTSATPINVQLRDSLCGAFTLSSEGVKTASGFLTAPDCW